MLGKIKIWLCRRLRNATYFLEQKEKSICFSKKDIQKIESGVEKIVKNAEKYERFEQKIPDLRELFEKNIELNMKLQKQNDFLYSVISELYVLEVMNERKKRFEIYEKLGFHTRCEKM